MLTSVADISKITRSHPMGSNVTFGSLADLWTNSNLMSAIERKADVRRPDFARLRFNVRFSRKRSFRLAKMASN